MSHAHNIPTQEVMFYSGKFGKDQDECFIRALIAERKAGAFSPVHMSSHAVCVAMGLVNEQYWSMLRADEAMLRMELQERYETFNQILRTRGVEWHISSNKIVADFTVWDKLIKANPLCRRYYHHGEPEWQLLQELFNPNVTEIINISDNSTQPGEVDQDDGFMSQLFYYDEDEEVASPVVRGVRGKGGRRSIGRERVRDRITKARDAAGASGSGRNKYGRSDMSP